MTIGEKIKAIRIQHKMNQGELASQLNLSTNLISKWENGDRNPSRDSMEQLSAIFSVNVDYFLPEKSALVSMKVFDHVENAVPQFKFDSWKESPQYEKIPADLVRNDIFNEDVTQMSQSEIDRSFFLFKENDGVLHVIKNDFTRIVDKQYYAVLMEHDVAIRQLFKNPDGSFFSIHVDTSHIEKLIKSGGKDLNTTDFSREILIQKEAYPAGDISHIIGIVVTTIRTITR